MLKNIEELSDSIKYNTHIFLEQCQEGIKQSTHIQKLGQQLRIENEKFDEYLKSLTTYETYLALYGLLKTNVIENTIEFANDEYGIELFMLPDSFSEKDLKFISRSFRFSFTTYRMTGKLSKDKKLLLRKSSSTSTYKLRDILVYLMAQQFKLRKKDEVINEYELI